MRVTLIRHGEAVERAFRDDDRALTKRGRSDVRRVGQALRRCGVQFSLVLSSPLVRAVQSAELVIAELEHRKPLIITRALIPDADADGIRDLLRECGDVLSVALVAHEPILSAAAAVLQRVPTFPSLRKAEAVRIRLPEGADSTGELRWRIDPATGKRSRP